jgi:hypothetical protein
MNFPLLTTVNQTITAMSNPSAPQFYEGELAVDRTSYPPLDINFPALQNVGSVVISGNISRQNKYKLTVSSSIFY